MRILRALVVGGAIVATAAPGLAEARGRHHGGGHRIGAIGLGIGLGLAVTSPLWAAPRYYAPAYYAPAYAPTYYAPAYYAPPAYAPSYYAPPANYAPQYAPSYAAPQSYAQPDYSAPQYPQSQSSYLAVPQGPQQSGSWYFCASVNGYYPYVKQCAEGWQQVAPTPPGR